MPIEQTTRKTFRFVGLRFDDLTLSEAVGSLRQSVATRRRQMVCSPNASLVVLANEDPQIRSIYNAAQMVTVDSHVVFYSAKLFGKPVREPVSTARLMLNMLPVCGAEKYRVYLLGAQEDVVRTVAERLPVDYPGIEVVGWRNGYFDFNDDSKVVQAIADAWMFRCAWVWAGPSTLSPASASWPRSGSARSAWNGCTVGRKSHEGSRAATS
jgi:N-acetylglucosaminyldiphosphoundecaprenol N-acetyl-beta-D-mannosaminyltransferase